VNERIGFDGDQGQGGDGPLSLHASTRSTSKLLFVSVALAARIARAKLSQGAPSARSPWGEAPRHLRAIAYNISLRFNPGMAV